jgi:hypothetical protein
MSYESEINKLGLKILQESYPGKEYDSVKVSFDMDWGTTDSYWGNESGSIDVYVEGSYLTDKGKRSSKTYLKSYDDPITFLKELLGD